jgi:5,10-methenyltetrahydromethanopterin hydrogenase
MWGWGPFSTVLTVTPSAKPDQMATVVATNDDQSGDVVMTWVIPSDNSSPITSYKIEFLDANALVWSQITTHCDGTNSAIMVAHQCTIPMAKFTATPLSLSLSDLIVVRASA